MIRGGFKEVHLVVLVVSMVIVVLQKYWNGSILEGGVVFRISSRRSRGFQSAKKSTTPFLNNPLQPSDFSRGLQRP